MPPRKGLRQGKDMRVEVVEEEMPEFPPVKEAKGIDLEKLAQALIRAKVIRDRSEVE